MIFNVVAKKNWCTLSSGLIIFVQSPPKFLDLRLVMIYGPSDCEWLQIFNTVCRPCRVDSRWCSGSEAGAGGDPFLRFMMS